MEAGPLTAATLTDSSCAMRSSTSARPSATEAIAPCPQISTSAWERATTTRSASSRQSTPATCAAAISPCE